MSNPLDILIIIFILIAVTGCGWRIGGNWGAGGGFSLVLFIILVLVLLGRL